MAYEIPVSFDTALATGDVTTASRILFRFAMGGENQELAYELCLKCLRSKEKRLWANAIQALGHIARVYGVLDSSMKRVIENALVDSNAIIRTQAEAAAMDVSDYLGWKIEGCPQ